MDREFPKDLSYSNREAKSAKIPWWSLANAHAVDTAAIIILWTALLAELSGIALHWYHYSISGLSIFLGYTADRLLDVKKAKQSIQNSLRHTWFSQNREWIRSLWILCLISNITLALYFLNRVEFSKGLLLMILSLLYTKSNHMGAIKIKNRLPNELLIALLLVLSILLFFPINMIADNPALAFLIAAIACLFFLNCLATSRSEISEDRKIGKKTLAHSRGFSFIFMCIFTTGMLLSLVCSLIVSFHVGLMLFFLFCSTALCLLLRVINQLKQEAFRIVIDTSLLAPGFLLISIF